MSLDGTSNTFIPYTINGINPITAGSINTANFVKYSGNTSNTNLNGFDLTTVGKISAQTFAIPDNITNDESWISYTVSTLGNPSSMGGLITTNLTSGSTMYFTGSVLGAPNFQFTTLGSDAGKVICTNGNSVFSTTISAGQLDYITGLTSQAGGVGQTNTWTGVNNFTTLTVSAAPVAGIDVVNLTTLTSAVAFIENVNALNYVPYTNPLQNLDMAGSTIKTTGYVSTAYLTLSEATNSEAWTLYTLSTMGNLSTLGGLVIQETTSGNSVYLTGGVVGAKNFQFSSPSGYAGKVVCTDGNSVMSTTISAGQLQYINALHSNAGGVGETNTWSNTQTFSVAPTFNSLTTATPSYSLGIDGSNQVIKFTPAVSGGTVNTSTTTARFIPYLSTATTLTNSLLNQIDNDSMGFGYTTIPNYPLGSGGKNMYVNGSIFAGGLNSMVGTFGRDTNTSNPANEITFPAGGAGTLLTQVKSHSGSSAFVDATWTYSNTNPAPLGANQGQVLLTAKNLNVSGIGNIYSGNPFAVPTGYMQTGSLTIGDCSLNYGGGTTLWNTNTAGLLMECLDKTEIAVHDAGTRVASMIFYDGSTNTFTMGRNMGWATSDVVASNNMGVVGQLQLRGISDCSIYNGNIDTYNPTGNNNLMIKSWYGIGFISYDGGVRIGMDTRTGNANFVGNVSVAGLIVNGGSFVPGCIYTDVNHGMLFRAKVPGALNIFLWNNSAGAEVLKMLSNGSMSHTQGDSSYMRYGPNATWNSYLTVGATPDRSGANNAQVITTNGNLHLDAGNSADIFYGYYANARGTPNIHRWYGGDYQFSGVAQNYNQYAQVCVFAGDQMRRSQAIQRKIADYYGGWGGGYNITYAFYKYNTVVPVRIHGY